MDYYKQLAFRYLKLNKNRCVITVIGTALTVMVLYTILNLGWSAVLNIRSNERQEHDYEIVFLTETKEQIDEIIRDDRIKSASVGSYYLYDYYEPKTYDNALYVNFKNPYNMDKVANEIENRYEISYEYNEVLATTYLLGGDDFLGVAACSSILLISFVFAIFGVGIVRNTIQLSTLEQIKDYGNLRCIGATKKQLKSVIYLEGAILETTGIVIGVIVGTLISMLLGTVFAMKASFHFLPLIPICIAFFGDLYFVMEECCKVVANMTPVSAIRGEYRIKKEKIKVRHSGLVGLIFGVEGDYAYKNIMRNPSRFFKTTWAIGIGVGAFIAVWGIIGSISKLEQDMEDSFGYYQIYFDGNEVTATDTVDNTRSVVNPEILEKMKKVPGITEATQVYRAQVLLKDWEDVYAHYTEDYKRYATIANWMESVSDKVDEELHSENKDTTSNSKSVYFDNFIGITLCGYEGNDLNRYKDVLVDGTLDVSENGILIINHAKVPSEEIDENYDGIEMVEVDYTDYKVGDTIDIIDMSKYRDLYLEQMESIKKRYEGVYNNTTLFEDEQTMLYETNQMTSEEREAYEELKNQYEEYRKEKTQLKIDCYDKLLGEGSYKTYTVEGILSGDVNRESSQCLTMIVPMEQYFAISGTEEGAGIGMQYHFDKFPIMKYNNLIGLYPEVVTISSEGEQVCCNFSMYPDYKLGIEESKGFIIGILFFVLFVVLISCINIVNTTASNIHIRRQEFAQLRVIGVSRKGLMKMVLLEGVISTIFANIIGMIIGLSISYGMFRMIVTITFGIVYKVPWIAMVISFVVSYIVLCGSIFIPLRKSDLNMAESLKISGE